MKYLKLKNYFQFQENFINYEFESLNLVQFQIANF